METLYQSNHAEPKGSIPAAELHSLIGKHVVDSLGSPDDIYKVKVFPVGSGQFRVNVLTGTDFRSARINNSYFLTADEKGNILDSWPRIVRET
jgi:hypothetical protein